jgi:hypothetical protein
MVDKTRNSKMLGRPKELPEETERLTFHLEKSIIESLRTYITKDHKISAILRDAAAEHLDKLRREESINKLRGKPLEPLLKIYKIGEEARKGLLPLMPFSSLVEVSRELLRVIEDIYSSRPPIVHKDPNALIEYADLISERHEQFNSIILDVYGRLLGFMAWQQDWAERFRRFKDSADKTLEEAKALKIPDISIPEIKIPGEKDKDK